MDKQLEDEFAQRFIGNTKLDLLHDVKATPTTLKAWIDANFISRQELVEKIKALTTGCSNVGHARIEDVLSLINTKDN